MNAQAQPYRLSKIPFVTLTLTVIVIMIQINRMSEGYYNTLYFSLASWFPDLFDQPWRVITSAFLHQNLWHFLDNLLWLVLFGWYNERNYGWRLMLGLFFGSVVLSSVVFLYGNHNTVEGISMFTFALFGFSLLANRRHPWWKTITHNLLHLLFILDALGVFAFVLNQSGFYTWVEGMLDLHPAPFNPAHLAHLVGLLYGLLFGLAFTTKRRWLALRWALLVVPAVCLISLLYSPWLPEWRLVKWGPILTSERTDCRTSAVVGDTPATLSIENQTAKGLAYYWINPEGKPLLYGVIQPYDNMKDQESFLTYTWCVVDVQTRQAAQKIVQTEAVQTVVIQDEESE
jgi:membrane associated rhomboid family serine protease